MKIGFLCGSLRAGSINKQLEAALIKRAKALGAKTSAINLNSFELPLYHGDLKTPANVKKLIRKMKGFDAIVITTPEYNGGLTPLLKNAIDWTSTIETGHITGPVYGIASATPGPMSGIMGMRQLACILNRLGAQVILTQVGCGVASTAFDSKGNLTAEPASALADKMLSSLMERAARNIA